MKYHVISNHSRVIIAWLVCAQGLKWFLLDWNGTIIKTLVNAVLRTLVTLSNWSYIPGVRVHVCALWLVSSLLSLETINWFHPKHQMQFPLRPPLLSTHAPEQFYLKGTEKLQSQIHVELLRHLYSCIRCIYWFSYVPQYQSIRAGVGASIQQSISSFCMLQKQCNLMKPHKFSEGVYYLFYISETSVSDLDSEDLRKENT